MALSICKVKTKNALIWLLQKPPITKINSLLVFPTIQYFYLGIEIVVELANTQAKIIGLQKKISNKEIEVIASMSKQ